MGLHLGAPLALLLAAVPAVAQVSTMSVRVFGSQSIGSDSIRLRIDDPQVPADVGAAAFTIEQWLRCTDGDNPPIGGAARGAGTEVQGFDWLFGRVFLDRDILNAPAAAGGDWGASVYPVQNDASRTVVRFGAERSGAQLTVQGSQDVCDGTWHHVAVGRNGENRLFLYVDGVADYVSDGTIAGNLSYPNGTGSGQDPFLVWGNEKHALQAGYQGYLDELRVWSVVRSAQAVRDSRFTDLAGSTAGLELYLKLDDGDRAANPEPLADETGQHAGAVLHDGVSGNGEWSMSVPTGGGGTSTTTSSTSSTSPTPTTSSSTSSSSSSSSVAPPPPTSTSTSSTVSTSSSSPTPTSSSTSSAPVASSTSSSSAGTGSSTTSTLPAPGSSSTTSLPSTSTTSTTVPRGCSSDASCDDHDPCTPDGCVAAACTHALPAGLAGAGCEIGRLLGAPLCPTRPPPARVKRGIARHIAVVPRLLEAAADAGPERPRGRRKLRAALRALRRAERRIVTAVEKGRLASECGAGLLEVAGRARNALVPADAVRSAPPSPTASW